MTEVSRLGILTERPRPIIKPGQEVWAFCEKLAQEHGLLPLDIFRRLILLGESVAKIEEMGGKVTGEVDGKVVRISAFGNVKNPTGL